MSNAFRWLLGLMGCRIEYVCDWGTYSHRYDGIDFHMGRPIHPDMSVAPPWAKRRITRLLAATKESA